MTCFHAEYAVNFKVGKIRILGHNSPPMEDMYVFVLGQLVNKANVDICIIHRQPHNNYYVDN